MNEQACHGETPDDSPHDASEAHFESNETNDPHDEDCRCAFCSRELTDETSIDAGYGPVCAKNNDLPWGDSNQEQPDGPEPAQEDHSFITRVYDATRRAAEQALDWTRGNILPRLWTFAHAADRRIFSPVRRALGLGLHNTWSRLRRSQLFDNLEQYWSGLTPRTRRVALALATVSAAIVIAVGLRGWTVDDHEPVALAQGQPESAASAAVRIEEAGQPILVRVAVGSAEGACTATARQRRQLASAASRQILPVVKDHPEEVVVISLREIPLSFSLLPKSERISFSQQYGANAAKRYESAVAVLLSSIIDKVERKYPHAVLSVHGLPIEPEQAGVSLEVAQQSNARYGTVIDGLGPFVPTRRFVVFGSTLDEKLLARMGMREALRLRDGRPIVFQTNVVWNALVDSEGLDYQDYLVAHASGRIERHGGTGRSGSPGTEVQVLLGDDPYWDP